MADLPPQISTHYASLEPPFPGAPGFTFHLTRLKDTLMVWVGGQSLEDDEARTRLAAEWAVAMPGRGNFPTTATHIYRSGANDVALSMSERLAKRFAPNQVHLSLSLPSSLTTTSKQTMDPYSSKAVMVMEKKLGTWIEEILEKEKQEKQQ